MKNNKNLSADLIRVGEYLYRGNERMARKFIQVCRTNYLLNEELKGVLDQIERKDGGINRASDLALTWGRLLLRN